MNSISCVNKITFRLQMTSFTRSWSWINFNPWVISDELHALMKYSAKSAAKPAIKGESILLCPLPYSASSKT